MPSAIEPKNQFKIENGKVIIALTQGQEAVVDLKDWTMVSGLRWYAHKTRRGFYASSGGGSRGSTLKRMHSVILGRPGVDHRDGDGLNNRRSNQRAASTTQQLANTRKRRGKYTSKFKGVHWSRSLKCWCVQVAHRHVGLFDDEIEAAKAYDEKAKELFGEFARLNFPESKRP